MVLLVLLCYVFLQTFAKEFPQNASYIDRYGEGYGTDWLYFPDEHGEPHFVPLTPIQVRLSLLPFNNAAEVEELVQFRFYDKKSSETYILLNKEAEAINENEIVGFSKAPYKIITHGWQSSADSDAVKLIAGAYLKNSNYNVIGIDWAQVADNLWYPIVAGNTKHIGDLVAIFLKALHKNHGAKDIHLIGHSLGAHIMGNAAYASKITVRRITGLDPARPLFEFPHREHSLRLDASDAIFVDVIHTCGGVLGFQNPIGHVDFYPNGGEAPQPGCGAIQHILESCSHGRAFLYFAESIENPEGFPAYPCNDVVEYSLGKKCNNSTAVMGEQVDLQARGKHFLDTFPEPLFGLASRIHIKD